MYRTYLYPNITTSTNEVTIYLSIESNKYHVIIPPYLRHEH